MKKNTKMVHLLCCILILTMIANGCGVIIEGDGTMPVNDELSTNVVDVNTDISNEIRPQDDFYGYRNKELLNQIHVKYGESYGGPATDIMNTVDDELKTMIKEIVESPEDYEDGSSEQVVKDAYLQCMSTLQNTQTGDSKKSSVGADDNTEAVVWDNDSITSKMQFEEMIQKVQNCADCTELLQVLGELSRENGRPLFLDIEVGRDCNNSSQNAIYLGQKEVYGDIDIKDLYEGDEAREQLYEFTTDTLTNLGEEPTEADRKAKELVYFLLEIADSTDYEVLDAQNRFMTFHPVKESDMEQMLSGFGLKTLEESYGMKSNPYGFWYIQDDVQLQKINSLYSMENLETLKTYIVCELMYGYQSILVTEYAYLEHYANIQGLSQEELATKYLQRAMPGVVSELYNRHYYTAEMDLKLKEMYADIVEGYRGLFDEADWMTQDTRENLKQKLNNITMVCGSSTVHYGNVKSQSSNPEESYRTKKGSFIYLDAEGNPMKVGKNLLDTYNQFSALQYEQALLSIGRPYDKERYVMDSFMVNAMYSQNNVFCISTAIMHAPYFDLNAENADNLGGLGMVIAHEIGHAFDQMCIVYDAEGNYRPDWIVKQDLDAMSERNQKMEDFYASYAIMDIYKVDAEKTCYENIADNSAMECIMKITHSVDERQRVFDNYGTIWCTMMEDSVAIDQLSTDVHSPAIIRVNGVLSATNEFYEVYNVKTNDGMYVAPELRPHRW